MTAVARPFTNFNFRVEVRVPGNADPICDAAFAECDGLEVGMDVKTIREGGNNAAQVRFAGPVTYGMLTLKRGLTPRFDGWNWMSASLADPSYRARATITLLAPDGKTEIVRFELARCLPVKIKSPALNAKEGSVAIEELQIAYETLTVEAASMSKPLLMGDPA
jgi:phage tail-like protein